MTPGEPTPAFAAVGSLAGRTILQIVPRLDAGGAERTTLDVAEALANERAIAKVAAEGGRLVSELQARGGVWLPFPASSKNPVVMLINTPRLARLIRDERVDIVHARSRAPAWVALRAARAARVPFVTTFHGAYGGSSSLKLLYNSVMARGDAVIANSDWTRRLVEELYPFSRERIHVIPRGVDLRAFAPDAVSPARVQKLRSAWGCGPDRRIVLLAARLTSWKGHLVLIEALKRLPADQFGDVCAIFAGDAQGRAGYAREIDAAARAAGLENRVRRVGHCADMPAALIAAAAIVAPSTKPEAFGRVAAEAQAMGALVIATDLGATDETLRAPPDCAPTERTGWRVPASDPQALALALKEALTLGAVARDALAHRARRHVERSFSLDGMTTRTLDVYRNLIDRAPRRS